MKNFFAFVFVGSLLLSGACGNHTSPAPSSPKADSTGSAFLPVADYLRGEISYVDSTPLAIRQYITRNNRFDSAFIRQGDFNRLAAEFLAPELDPDSFPKNYKESSFMDKTTGYLSFTYSTQNKALSLQRVDVLVAPGAATDNIKSIYLERIFPAGDTTVTKKLFWQTGTSFQIFTSKQFSGGAPLEDQLKVVWE